MLRVTNVSTFYNRIQALHNVSIHVKEGELVTLIGANGAGKTTLLNTISQIIKSKSGEILFNGENLSRYRPDQVVKAGISQVPEGRQIFFSHTVMENLELGAYLRYNRKNRSDIKRDMEKVFAKFQVLKDRQKQIAGTLSGGEQQMLAIGRALMAKPRILLLDEPSMGLAPLFVKEIFSTIKELHEEGTTILLVEQNARAALQTANRGYVLETGRVVLEGAAAELLEDPEVKRAYLGKDYGEIWER